MLHNFKVFSSLDLQSGYYQSKTKTAFLTTSEKWHWNVAQFRICSLHGIFCYLMSQILTDLDFCFTYLGDIFIYITSWKKTPQANANFFKQHLHYLGHLMLEKSIQSLLDILLKVTNIALNNYITQILTNDN